MSDSSTPSGDKAKNPVTWLKNLIGKKSENDASLREALEDYIEELEEHDGDSATTDQEKILLQNILELRNRTVTDVMIPRVDIAAIDISSHPDTLIAMLAEKHHSRVPVYRNTLDDIIGVIHMKDVIARLAQGQGFELKDVIREVPIVSPGLPVLDLLMLMRETRQHMVFIVDEYGGIDGLATLGDVLTSIVGEIHDGYETTESPEMRDKDDGSVHADARIPIRDFEEKFGEILTDDEREEVETLGGYITFLADRVPARGEIICHKESGLIFEILEADPRRIIRLRIRDTRPAEQDLSAGAA